MAAAKPIPIDYLPYLQKAGFSGPALKTAWAIAKRESGGNPLAHNTNTGTGDNSYGLFQINMLQNLGPARRKAFGLSSNDQLLDPMTNAKAAFQLSKQGTDFGAWGIGPNAYRKMPALDFSGFPGPSAGATLPSGGGVADQAPATSFLPQQQGGNGLASTLAIINAFRNKASGAAPNVLPLVGQLMQLNQRMPQVQSPAVAPTATATSPSTSLMDSGKPPVAGYKVGGGVDVRDVNPALVNMAKSYGLDITSGFRSVEKQASLYAGRSHSGSVAAPGKSFHNHGRAIDVAPNEQGLAFLKYALAHPSEFREVFYDPAGISIKNGKIVNYTIGGHTDHIHVAV